MDNGVLEKARKTINEKIKEHNPPSKKYLNIDFDSLRSEYSPKEHPDMAVLFDCRSYNIILVDEHGKCKMYAEALQSDGISPRIRTINLDGIKYFKPPLTR
ncbi:MAG: hypothetical protein JSV92_03805 [archaeon]|nr:MAG: hypothetical protein JSV92_03805 [archaeon]